MLCAACGAQNRDDAPFCLTCRATIPAAGRGAAPAPAAPGAPAADTSWGVPYYDRDLAEQVVPAFAGFWDRAFALILDSIFGLLLAVPPAIALAAIGAWLAFAGQGRPLDHAETTRFDHNVAVAAIAAGVLTMVIVPLAYQLIMTARGGGWGMRILGIRVVRADNGENPGYGRALGRMITRGIFGVIPVIGTFLQFFDHVWMIWDEHKQTWHDKAAGTYVVRR